MINVQQEHLAEQLRATEAALAARSDAADDPEAADAALARWYPAGTPQRRQLAARARVMQAQLLSADAGELVDLAGHAAGLVSELLTVDDMIGDDTAADLEEIGETFAEITLALRGAADRQRLARRAAVTSR
ncbi:MAG: hypothetical protein ACRD0P_28705 [Stackebrandtia sp.]